MSLNTALATPQYTKLRDSGYAGEMLVSLFSNRVVLSGTITSDLTSSDKWAQFNYTALTGSYTDVVDQQCLLIGTVNDIKQATFYGRIRGLPSSGTITCNQSSQDFSPGTYFWVIDNHLPQYRGSRPSSFIPADAVELVDYDETFQRMLPVLVGLQTVYVGYVDPITGKLRLGFDLSRSYAAESGATIAALAYILDGTLIAGSFSGPIAIVDFDPGEQYGIATATDSGGRSQARYFGIKAHDPVSYPPDSGFEGGSIESKIDQGMTFSITAFADVDEVLINTTGVAWRNNEIYGTTQGSLYGGGSAAITNKALTSQTAMLTAAGHPYAVGQTVINADCGAGFDGTFVITATTANTYSFHSDHANVASTPVSGMSVVNPNNVMFVGWLQGEDDPITGDVNFSVVATANFRFTGVGPRLQRLKAQLLPLVESSSPSIWGEINSLNPWRGILEFLQRYTTVTSNCDVTFSDTSSQFAFPDMSTQGGNALGAVQWLAELINAVPAFGPAGQIAIDRDITYLSDAERAAQITNVANWQAQDALNITRSSDPNKSIGYVSASGACFNTANSQVSTFVAQAPGITQDEAAGSGNLPSQILIAGPDMDAAKRELQARAGSKFKYENLQEYIDADHPDGYAGVPIIASRSQTYTWTLTEVGGPNNVNRVIYDTSVLWVVDSAGYKFDEKIGGFTLKVRYRRVIDAGDAGDDLTQYLQADNQTLDPIPDFGLDAFGFDVPELTVPDEGFEIADIAPAALMPPPDMIAGFKGQELITWNASKVFYEKNVINLKKPQCVDITPSNLPGGFSVQQCVIDPSFTNTVIPAYCLASDGTDSQVGYCSNIAAPGASELWTFGATVSGLYTVIRATGVAGTIGISQPESATPPPGAWSRTWDFLTSPGSWYAVSTPGFYDPVWTPGIGWQSGARIIPGTIRYLSVSLNIANGTISNCTIWYNWNLPGSGSPSFSFTPNTTGNNPFDPPGVFKLFGPQGSLTNININTQVDDPPSNMAYFNLTAVQFGGPSNNPFSSATVAFSDDYGATFDTPLDVGDSMPGGVGGFDIQRAGTVSYAASQGAIYKASTLGGAYSFFAAFAGANPVCAILPYFDWSNAKNTSGGSPDVLVGLDASDGTGSLKWIEGGGTVHDITPAVGFVFDNPNSITISYNHHILVSGSVSGVPKVYRSTDKGTTWSLVSSGGSPTFIRTRRNDDRAAKGPGTNLGQCYIADGGEIGYTSKWASAGFAPKTQPVAITGFDTIF